MHSNEQSRTDLSQGRSHRGCKEEKTVAALSRTRSGKRIREANAGDYIRIVDDLLAMAGSLVIGRRDFATAKLESVAQLVPDLGSIVGGLPYFSTYTSCSDG